ncbi:MAG: Transcriptional regulator, AcrR family [uncultured Paraburkholderia sp.]|nr:MAG: Transcriptional regulator, AcrR family [uncultured Paraburkholderia sp.]
MNQPKIKRDPEGTRRRILLAAAEEFANGGLFGARVDQLARRAETNERMLTTTSVVRSSYSRRYWSTRSARSTKRSARSS